MRAETLLQPVILMLCEWVERWERLVRIHQGNPGTLQVVLSGLCKGGP